MELPDEAGVPQTSPAKSRFARNVESVSGDAVVVDAALVS